MSSTSSASATESPTDITNPFDSTAGKGQSNVGISLNSFLASVAVAAAIFAVEFVFQPRTYLVPPKERTESPPSGIISWIKPVFRTSNSDFINKCGLDAYFFLRYLRTLLKIFLPLALLILPVLVPLNSVGGRGSAFAVGAYDGQTNVTGLDQLSWGNVRPEQTSRYWAHLVLAITVVVYSCYTFYDELRGYIRLRQAYLTSPQHRLRASATTVLVQAIPRKWLTVEALDGLYDVFPGGVRNIWINRDFDELSDKVKRRNKYARSLEAAETDLVKKAKKAHSKRVEAEEKKRGQKQTKADKVQKQQADDAQAQAMAEGAGMSTGDPHQVRHTLHDVMNDRNSSASSLDQPKQKLGLPVIGRGLHAVGDDFGKVKNTIFGGFKRAGKELDDRMAMGMQADGHQPVSTQTDTIGDGVAPGYNVHHAMRAPYRTGHDRSKAATDGATDREDIHPAFRSKHNEHARGGTLSTGNPARTPDLLTVPTDGAAEKRPLGSGLTIEEATTSKWMFWLKKKSAQSKSTDGQDDERPLSDRSPVTPRANPQAVINGKADTEKEPRRSWNPFAQKGKKEHKDKKEATEYPAAYSDDATDDDGEAVWKQYLKPSDRETMRLPMFGWEWMPSLPLLGKKVDTIYYCRKEVARLNVEIEQDQQHPEDFPLMNSAFIQFNHQVAAHMACQSLSHHVPKYMDPRIVEISPDDVLWDNMSVRWWERYIRTTLIMLLVLGLIIGWAFPVTFTGLLSQLRSLTALYPWLAFINRMPQWLLSLVQGVLPQALLGLLMALLPIILRMLTKQQGVPTGMGVELSVQNYYFAFLFVQVFLVVSISSGITSVIRQLVASPGSVPSLLATNLPRASNYFFSYMLLQAFSVSAGALVQIGGLISWFILAPLLDNTARQKWARQTNLPQMQWGTFFPVYTNLAAIGLIYSVISPLILIFNLITFSLFWVVYRYNTLYVTKFRFDTGGLLYPKAINQLFTGLYVMELCLVGLFFIVRDADNNVACKGQAIIMIVVGILTFIFQWLLNDAFAPLFRYLPITLEDEAVIRDEQFARAQHRRMNLSAEEDEGEDLQHVLEDHEERERQADHEAEEIEMREIAARKRNRFGNVLPAIGDLVKKGTGADGDHPPPTPQPNPSHRQPPATYPHRFIDDHTTSNLHMANHARDVEAQTTNPIGDALFSGLNDEIEDLTPQERDKLIQRAFQHEALRAKRPVIWIPRDGLGVSDDEVYRTQRLSKHVWISNEYTGLDGKGRVVYRRSPPDFSEVDLIEL
ncbi:MAG: hypothetical protein M1817_002068 [Caeruleum heppii]|nr:MAG: hypothetical protein M1817_002068 [Caeruleum heppii]